MMATLTLDEFEKGQNVFLRVKPGGGKSFIILLMCYYLYMKYPDKKVTVVVMNEILLDQMRKHANQFDLPRVNFRTYKSMTSEEHDLVIFDEYYHHVRTSMLHFDTDGYIDEPFNFHEMGNQQILLGGH